MTTSSESPVAEASVQDATAEAVAEQAAAAAAQELSAGSEPAGADAEAAPLLGPRTKRRRTSKPDAVLAEAADVALAGILEITDRSTIGEEHRLLGVEDRLTTHCFECTLPGYRGWFWFATLSRVPRGKVATVCEVGLMPGEDALLAPAWVPWSERVRPEEIEEERRTKAAEEAAAQTASTGDAPSPDATTSAQDSVAGSADQGGADAGTAPTADAAQEATGTEEQTAPDPGEDAEAEEISAPSVPQFLAPHIVEPTKG